MWTRRLLLENQIARAAEDLNRSDEFGSFFSGFLEKQVLVCGGVDADNLVTNRRGISGARLGGSAAAQPCSQVQDEQKCVSASPTLTNRSCFIARLLMKYRQPSEISIIKQKELDRRSTSND